MSKASPSQIPPEQPLRAASKPRPTFSIACWLLALVAFAQLITVGTALTVRSNLPAPTITENPTPTPVGPQEPIQPRSVAEILASIGEDPSPSTYQPLRVPASQPSRPQSFTPPPTNQPHLAIANPRVERLVQEARNLQLEGDMINAVLKLDEASRIDPEEPAVTYHTALLAEEMGMYSKAADNYQKIQQMGIKAGNYYRLAAAKLIKGMGKSIQRNDLVIGPLKSRKAKGDLAGKHVDVAITLLARPDKVINADDVEVQVHFYDRMNGGEIKKADPTASITSTWEDSQVNWQDVGNEETLNVAYTIPDAHQADEYLFGRREYYGYVVELLYKGDVIDQQAQPRRLHSIHGGKARLSPDNFLGDPFGIPLDGGSLLPKIDSDYHDDLLNPPLPSR